MKLIAKGTMSGQDLSSGFVALTTLPPPAEGGALYRVMIKLSALDAAHALSVRESQDELNWTYENAGTNGLTSEIVELETPVSGGESPVLVSIQDAAGLSTQVALSWFVYQIDLINQPVAIDPDTPVITPPDSPGQTTGYVVTREPAGVAQANQQCQFRLIRPPPGDGNSYELSKFTATSDNAGLLQVALLRDSVYEGRRGTGQWVRFVTPDAPTCALPILLGEADS